MDQTDQEKLAYGVHVLKSLFDNYQDFLETNDSTKANLMLEKIIEESIDVAASAKSLKCVDRDA